MIEGLFLCLMYLMYALIALILPSGSFPLQFFILTPLWLCACLCARSVLTLSTCVCLYMFDCARHCRIGDLSSGVYRPDVFLLNPCSVLPSPCPIPI